MIPGYNHNVKYNEVTYHVQTEDSGVVNPHIITHLFFGGNIIESRKTSYADIVHSQRLSDMLVELMQEQHKAMLKDLIGGRFDDKIAQRSVNAATLNGPAPLNVDAGAQHRASLFMPDRGKKPAAAPPKPPPLPRPAPVVPIPAPPPPVAAPEVPSLAAQAGQVIEAETLQKAFESTNEHAVDSIFGEDLISEKSLDEVILSYLAEDMQKE